MLSDKLEVKRQRQALLFQDWEFCRKAVRKSSPPVFLGSTVASWVDREENAVVGPVPPHYKPNPLAFLRTCEVILPMLPFPS